MAGFARTSLSTLLLATALAAHGGQYLGPRVVPPGIPRVPTALPVRAPSAVPTPSPTTGARDLQPDAATWQTWWEFNKEPYLRPRIETGTQAVTGSDDFYIGLRRPSLLVDVLTPTEDDRRQKIVPALVAMLEADRNRDVQSAVLIALGKVGEDPPGKQLESLLASRLSRDDQEVRETAVLALGIAGREAAFPMLVSLLADDAQGRALVERSEVRDRTRAFAAHSLGFLVRRLGDVRLMQEAHDALWKVLDDRRIDDRDMRTAAVSAIGLLRADPGRSADKRLAWMAAERLLDWFLADRGSGDEPIQAHAATAIGRLLGRGTTSLHERCKRAFIDELDDKDRRGPSIRQSAAIALGMLCEPEEVVGEDAAGSKALRSHYERGHDQAARAFALMALARIGGEANRDWLLRSYAKGNKSMERPWLALALGVLCERRAAAGSPDRFVGQMLFADLEDASTDDQRAALAVSLGLTGYAEAAPVVMKLLREGERDERTAGYLCISLGLLGDAAAVPQLEEVLGRSLRRPFLLQQCAVALGCLGDRNANQHLLAMLKESDSAAVLAALATAIGRIGDRRSIDPLIGLSNDRDLTKLSRAFVGAGLGWIGDKDALPWNVPLSVDSNWATSVDTLSNGATGVLDIL